MNTTKSYGEFVLGLYEAMLVDIALSFPGLRTDCMRDYKRLLSALEHHGIAFFCITLADFGKTFDKALSDERLTRSGMAHMRPYKKESVIPRLFRGLLLRVFQSNGDLLAVPDLMAIRRLRQLYRLAKNAKLSCSKKDTAYAVELFVDTDREVRDPSLIWDDPDSVSSGSHRLSLCDEVRGSALPDGPSGPSVSPSSGYFELLSTTQRVADVVAATLGRFDPLEWRNRHGPGAVAEKIGMDTKYSFPVWPARLELGFPYADFGCANFSEWAERVKSGETPSDEEGVARLIAVPKSLKTPRLIAAEPTAHMWCQQSILDFLTKRVSKTPISSSIDFRDQMKNGQLALSASHSGSHATIDLKEASDRISCWVIERVFRSNPTLLHALCASRTGFVRQEIASRQPELIKLRKFSTMGSAVTFPIQTILFTIVGISALLNEENKVPTMDNIRRAARRVQVFGDDIIVPTHACGRTQELLEILGLRINTSKTFRAGKFRESCGVDAYDGVLIPKVNVNHAPARSKPESIASAVDCHNHLLLEGLWNAANYVRTTVAQWIDRYTIPEVGVDSGAFGWFTFCTPENSRVKTRWNSRLHRREHLVSVMKKPSERIHSDSHHSLLQYFSEYSRSAFIGKGERLGVVVSGRALKLQRSWVPVVG